MENRNDSDIENSMIEKNAKTAEKSAGLSFTEILSHPMKTIKLDLGKNVCFIGKLSFNCYSLKCLFIIVFFIFQLKSPSLSIKSSSIAGLSPLLKRTKSAESYKLSPLSNDKPETYSILKRPRLIQNHHQSKKSELRPQRLIAPNSFNVNATATTSHIRNQQSQSIIDPNTASGFSNKLSNLNNRFRSGTLSKFN